MKRIAILDKLAELGLKRADINLGSFDVIGELTARKRRDEKSEGFRRHGAFFRPNYERGVLIHSLIKHFRFNSLLEIGFGRGYAAVCAARAFEELGGTGKVTSIDPAIDEKQLKVINDSFPDAWTRRIELLPGTSKEILPRLTEPYDIVYIDGDHCEEATRFDWSYAEKLAKKFVLFDDYHRSSSDPNIQCAIVIDAIQGYHKELILMDRRIFCDDRSVSDDELDYGQVLLTK
jgi:hypothetical protein